MKKIIYSLIFLFATIFHNCSAADYHASIKKICDKTAKFTAGLCLNPNEVKKYLVFARAAYKDDRQPSLNLLTSDGWAFTDIGHIGGIGAGLVAHKKFGSKLKIVVAYHGTESSVDWALNINALLQSADSLGLSGNMHQGFYLGSDQTWGKFKTQILKIIKDEKVQPADVEYFVTGHSLGGSLAIIAGVRIARDEKLTGSSGSKKDSNQVKVITVGQPRVFMKTKSASGAEGKLGVHNILRFWNSGDPVSAVPLGANGFKHIGTSIRLSNYESVLDEMKSVGIREILSHFLKKHEADSYEEQVPDVFTAYQKKPVTHKGIVRFAEKCAKNVCSWVWSKAKEVVGK